MEKKKLFRRVISSKEIDFHKIRSGDKDHIQINKNKKTITLKNISPNNQDNPNRKYNYFIQITYKDVQFIILQNPHYAQIKYEVLYLKNNKINFLRDNKSGFSGIEINRCKGQFKLYELVIDEEENFLEENVWELDINDRELNISKNDEESIANNGWKKFFHQPRKGLNIN